METTEANRVEAQWSARCLLFRLLLQLPGEALSTSPVLHKRSALYKSTILRSPVADPQGVLSSDRNGLFVLRQIRAQASIGRLSCAPVDLSGADNRPSGAFVH